MFSGKACSNAHFTCTTNQSRKKNVTCQDMAFEAFCMYYSIITCKTFRNIELSEVQMKLKRISRCKVSSCRDFTLLRLRKNNHMSTNTSRHSRNVS